MGVRGLTTFIASRSSQYHESYELHDCNLVIDGNSIASQLYKWHCKCNDCFGGDYDKYANVIKSFYRVLSDCNIIPFVIFDGAYEKRKLKTVYSRMRDRVNAAKRLNSVTEGSVSMFPLFLRELFVDITLRLNVKCMRCDFESDSGAAFLARSLNCPILSYDSDFYIFDVLYIPFSTVDLRLRKNKTGNYISCDVYSVDKFLNSFGGLDKINLPLLAVLLGNDYVKRKTFSHFYRYLKMQKSRHENEQQRMIKSLIMWLKNETPESALRKILGRYKFHNRRKLAKKIEMGIEGYQCSDSHICTYFNIGAENKQENNIIIPNPEEIETVDEDDLSEDEDQNSSGDASDEEITAELTQNKFNVPSFLHENYRKCLYPSCFMDMVISNTYYCIPQVEDYSLEHSHIVSLDILAIIYKILTFPETKKFTYVARNEHADIKKYTLPQCDKEVPKLSEMENLNSLIKKEILLDLLNIESYEFLNVFPSSWHLYLISLKYWVAHSKIKIDMSYISSLVLCGIVLNYVDNRVGFYRSTKSFMAKYSTNNTSKKKSNFAKSITQLAEEVDLNDSIACMQKLISYFQMDAKMRSNIKLFDVSIVHRFGEFQSCLLHIKYLNSLLNFPFLPVVISDFFDGTFLYNMTANLKKRTDLKAYMQMLLDNCPKILKLFEMMTEQIEVQIGSKLVSSELSKRKKKKKKAKSYILEEDKAVITESDEDAVLDPNNKYSILSLVNK